ncbi:Fanconi anemia group B protein [Nothobranchius furzeri]|uniref:Fanconi anemia complementation group B n=2 Tax=Nothobranchius TaxID=28779 RepID=A0A1A8A4K2_NOTFU|nr:Fanconi anemia group B protein [Nothobranchius furzeri]KAF7215727.1 Fanconi anemia complementation group B [Nothobranchius furzeri]
MEGLSSDIFRQNFHLISHFGKIISFNCKQYSTVSDGEVSELIFRRFFFEPRGNAFLKAAEGSVVISRKTTDKVEIATCKCVTDVQKRARTPCVLVSKKRVKGDKFVYRLFTLSSLNCLEPCIEFKLSYEMQDSVCILQGPTVLWCHENRIFYTSIHAEGVKQIPIEISHCIFGELPIPKGHIFVLGLQSRPEQLPNNHPTNQVVGYFPWYGQVFNGAAILPHPYIPIAQCVLVLSAEKDDHLLKCAVVAATSNQQLVYFENGIVKDVCKLPFEHAEDIQVVNTGRNGILFVIFSKQGNACAIWKETFQVASHWSGVSSVYVDDYLGCGTDQMLLFRDQGAALESFLLTDLCGISFSWGQESEASKTTPPPQENFLLTLQALESRLQSGLIVLQELQSEVRVKDRVLQQSVRVLTDALSEQETVLSQHEQEGLVALWDSDDESKEETSDDRMQDTPAVSWKPQIDKLWHRFTGDRMVVGVILTTESATPVTDVSLSLLTEAGQSSVPAVIQTLSQVFRLPAHRPSTPSLSSSTAAFTFSEPAAKRSKQRIASDDLHTSRVAVTGKTELAPMLTSGCVKCRVMLHYAQKADALSPVSKPTPTVLHCGQISVDIHDVVPKPLLKTPEIKTDEVSEDLLSLLTVLDHWVLHIDSPDYSLGDVGGWIQKREGCKKVEVSPQYLIIDSSAPSGLMLLHWDQITPFRGELSIHCSQLQMLQFLDSLLAFLPASCFIQPVKHAKSQSAAQVFALVLEDEVLSLRECVSLLLCGEEAGNEEHCEETPDPGCVEGLQRSREGWQQAVERSRRRLSPLVDVGMYREVIRSISDMQMDGDLAGLIYTQRT